MMKTSVEETPFGTRPPASHGGRKHTRGRMIAVKNVGAHEVGDKYSRTKPVGVAPASFPAFVIIYVAL